MVVKHSSLHCGFQKTDTSKDQSNNTALDCFQAMNAKAHGDEDEDDDDIYGCKAQLTGLWRPRN
jgi:hypothetical protein